MGIIAICAVVVACFKIATAIRNILPKFGLEDIGHVIEIMKSSMAVMKNAPQAAKEFRDLDPNERMALGALVKNELINQGVDIENVDQLTERALTAIDAIMDFVALLPRKPADSDTSK